MTYITIILSYLVGSIPFGDIIGRLWGVNVREHGSGNIGFTNVLRVIGKVPGVIVLVLDIGKGVVAVLGVARLSEIQLSGANILPVLCGVAAICGHNWTVFLKFRGGKGIATTIGAFLALNYIATLISVAVWFTTVIITRYVSFGSVLLVLSLPVATSILGYFSGWDTQTTATLVAAILTAILAIYRHKENIARLLKGEERKIGQKENA